ncbi:hypothetical protein WJX73_007368 [Symbiochloris irregularis]|uniref:Trichohyalin-plectin-homology domain-containing protein n=1 Tax=Symbiochloris irregularis TaxID=706552 RepID=A0AAW1NQS8_9CHLO
MAPTTVTIISKSHLEAIRAKAAPPPPNVVDEEALRLKALSEEKASRWPDTLQAQRRERDAARKQRLDEEEAVRQELDRREAELRDEQRRHLAEQAQTALWEQSALARAVRSQLLLSEVMAERQTQIAEQEYLRAVAQAQEGQYLAQLHGQLQAQDDAEKARQAEEQASRLHQKAILLQQLEELREAILAEREVKRLEGERIVKQAVQAQEAAQEEEARVRARAVQALRETQASNQVLLAIKAQQRRAEAEADERIKMHAAQQEAFKAQQAAEQATKIAAVAKRRAAIIEAAERVHAAMQEAAAARVNRDIAQLKDTQAQDAAREAAKRKQQQQDLERSWADQLAARAEAAEAANTASKAAAENLAVKLATLKALDEEEAARLQAREHQQQAFLLHQIARKQAHAASERFHDHEETLARLWAQREMEGELRAKAAVLVEEWAQSGKPQGPLGRPLQAAIKLSMA